MAQVCAMVRHRDREKSMLPLFYRRRDQR